MMHCQIILPIAFTERHQRAVEQYITVIEEPIAADFLARLLQLADPERE